MNLQHDIGVHNVWTKNILTQFAYTFSFQANVQGDECNICQDGHFFLSESNPDGCLKCWCSGVTNRCSSSRDYREQIPMNLFNGHGFTLADRLDIIFVLILKLLILVMGIAKVCDKL